MSHRTAHVLTSCIAPLSSLLSVLQIVSWDRGCLGITHILVLRCCSRSQERMGRRCWSFLLKNWLQRCLRSSSDVSWSQACRANGSRALLSGGFTLAAAILEKLKGLVAVVERKLGEAITVPTYGSYAAFLNTPKEVVKERALHAGESCCLLIPGTISDTQTCPWLCSGKAMSCNVLPVGHLLG